MQRRFAFGSLAGLLWSLLATSPSLGAVDVAVTAAPDPARPGEVLDVEVTVSNDGAFARTDLAVLLDFPTNVNQLSNSLFDGSCPSVACEPGEQAQFDIATLPAGKAVTYSMPIKVAAAVADATVIPFDVEVFDGGLSVASASADVTVDASRLLELALADRRDPVRPGGVLHYTLTFGVVETSPGSPAATLSLPVPAGTSFVSASHGGALNGGAVEWSLGNLNPGSSGERQATFTVGAGTNAGSIAVTEATFADVAGNAVACGTTTRVQDEIPLELTVVAGPDPTRPGERMDVELTVHNTGVFDRTGVVLTLEIPDEIAQISNSLYDGACPSVSCEPQERATFDLGTLRAGRGRNFSIPLQAANAAVDGTVIALEAQVSDSTGDLRESATTLAVLDGREVELALVENRDPVSPGGALDYTLTFGSIETSAGSPAAMLRLPLPPGTSLLSASDGGTLNGNVVEWSLGSLNPGRTGERRVSLAVDAAVVIGSILTVEATYDDFDGKTVRHQAATRVQDEIPLELDVIASPDPAQPGETLDVELSVTNTGTFDRSGTVLTLEFPDDAAQLSNSLYDGSCASVSCEPGETATFSIGTLPAGKGVSYSMPLRVANATLDGTTIALEAQVTDSTGDLRESGTVIAVDETRNLDLALSEADEPVAPGSTIAYVLTYGTFATGGGAPGTRLLFSLPAGTSFVSASDGGLPLGDEVEWDTASLDPGAGGDRSVVVQVDAALLPGTILEAAARFDDAGSPAQQVRFEESTRLSAAAPLEVELDAAPAFAPPGTTLDVQVSVTNSAALERTGIVLRLEVPEGVAQLSNSQFAGTCPSVACEVGETATFDVGTLGPGQTAAFAVPFVIHNASLPGLVINFDASAFDSTGFVGQDGDAVMVGTDFDGGRSAGAGAVSDGSTGSPLLISKSATCADVTLTWTGSCLTADNDYAIYEGSIGDFSSYTPRVCSTGGSSSVTFTPSEGSVFFLVVPQNGVVEGSYGRDVFGTERAPSSAACLPQQIATTCE